MKGPKRKGNIFPCDNCGQPKYVTLGSKYKHHFCSYECFKSWIKGKSKLEILGKEKFDETVKKISKTLTGKTWEILYGKEKADEMKEKMSKLQTGKVSSAQKIEKISKTWKLKYEEGYVNPKKGTKTSEETKEKLSRIATKIRNDPNFMIKLSGTRHERSYEGIEHKKLKKKIGDFLQSKGYEVYYEVYIFNYHSVRIADVVGFKGQEKVVVECGNINKKKLSEYKTVFQYIIHIPYSGEIKYLRGLPY
jgi:hypothetical protein